MLTDVRKDVPVAGFEQLPSGEVGSGGRAALVSVGAMWCNPRVTESILGHKADYLIALKGKQGTLLEEVETFFTDPPSPLDTHTTHEKGHVSFIRRSESHSFCLGYPSCVLIDGRWYKALRKRLRLIFNNTVHLIPPCSYYRESHHHPQSKGFFRRRTERFHTKWKRSMGLHGRKYVVAVSSWYLLQRRAHQAFPPAGFGFGVTCCRRRRSRGCGRRRGNRWHGGAGVRAGADFRHDPDSTTR